MMMPAFKDVGIILMDQDKDSIQNFRGKKLGFFRNTREMLAGKLQQLFYDIYQKFHISDICTVLHHGAHLQLVDQNIF